jgi:hypothetical protein
MTRDCRRIPRSAQLALVAIVSFLALGCQANDTDTIEVTDYTPKQSSWDELLSDDRIGDKHPAFDPELVHPVPVQGWSINLSDAVIKLDVPMLRPDADQGLLVLHPSYAAALDSAGGLSSSPARPLPSVNLIDGQAKQFDDGLVAALDLAYFRGDVATLPSQVELIKKLAEAVGPANPAAPFVSAGLELAGIKVPVDDQAAREKALQDFLSDEVRSKPIGVYTWNEDLAACFRFLRFFQEPLPVDQPLTRDLARVLLLHPELAPSVQQVNDFHSRLTNPPQTPPLLSMLRGLPGVGGNRSPAGVALFPASMSVENELFARLFADGLPPGADLMRALITRIRSGEVDLTPNATTGWYGRQVYALETLLLPERGRESEKLLLTRSYKRRMLEAFQALVTKRRETHIQTLPAGSKSAVAIGRSDLRLSPPLRIEPAATFYLRTARAYAFLANFLDSSVGVGNLTMLRGLRQDGPRSLDLRAELAEIRDRFYGFYLVSCQDIGLNPELAEDEGVDSAHCLELATSWLASDWAHDADLSTDTRVSVPIYFDRGRNVTRLWVTLGVRLTRLHASFARGPQVRSSSEEDWSRLPAGQLDEGNYLIPVDEFAEVELGGNRVLTREELRDICSRHRTRLEILKALNAMPAELSRR